MTVKRLQFLELLKMVFLITDTKGTGLQGFDCFLFSGGYLSAYNNYSSISVKLPDSFDIDYMAINAKSLKSIFEKMQGDEITLTFKDDVLKIKDGTMIVKIQATLFNDDSNKYDINHMVETLNVGRESGAWEVLPEDFLSACAFCVIPNDRNQMTGIYVEGHDVFNSVACSLLWFKLNEEGEGMSSFYIPDDKVKDLLKIEFLKNYFVEKDKWVHFCSDNEKIYFSIRLITDYTFNKEGRVKLRDKYLHGKSIFSGFLPGDFKGVVDRALIFIEKYNNKLPVKLTFDEKGVTVNAKKNKCEFEEYVAWQGKLKSFTPFSLWVNITDLISGLRESLLLSVFERVTITDGRGKEVCTKDMCFSNLENKMFVFTMLLRKEGE